MTLKSCTLTNFSDLSKDEKLQVLAWRNSDNIRKWMYNSDMISESDHLHFIDTLGKAGATRQYFLASTNSDKLGVIYFTDIDIGNKTSDFGIYANPESKGVGRTLMRAICEYAFEILGLQHLVAEVFSNNEKAIALYQQFGFKEVDRKTVNNSNVIIMELYNENR